MATLVGRLNTSTPRISAVQKTTVLGQPSNVVTLKNTLKDQIELSQIVDIVEGTPSGGETLVYDATLDKYVVTNYTPTSLDGGGF